MSVISAIRSKLSGQSLEEFGEGQRFPLSKVVQNEIRRHVVELSKADLKGYTFERRRSAFAFGKSDLVIYDSSGNHVLEGREMARGAGFSFWQK
jgi:hypothetical protein